MEIELISSTEIMAILKVSRQRVNQIRWLPPVLKKGKNCIRLYNKSDVMKAIHSHKKELAPTIKRTEYVITESRFREAAKTLITNVMLGKRVSYDDYKIVENKGDLMLSLRLKQNTSKPYLYERRLDIVQCDWMP